MSSAAIIIFLSAAILVSGGAPLASAGRAVEVLRGDGSPWCKLPDLPDPRYWHSQAQI